MTDNCDVVTILHQLYKKYDDNFDENSMDGRNITVKRMEADDVELFRRIRLEALSAEPASYASSYDDWVAYSADEWKQRLTDPVFVALRDDEPVGLIGLLRQRASKMAHRATIVMVYVRKDLRGGVLAKNLLQVAADYAWDSGIRQLELVVSAENPAAIRFYQREGFAEVGRIPGASFKTVERSMISSWYAG